MPIEEVPEASYDSTVPPTPMPVPVNRTTSNDSLQDCISSLTDKLSRTQLADLVSNQPLTSTFEMPSLAIRPIETSEPSNMLDVDPSTTNEVLLLAALREAEEQCTMYKKCVIALQAQAVLNEAYCNKLRYQLAFKEEKLANPDVPGKLVEDGLPWLLSGDEFYDRVVKFTQWQKEKAQEKEVRKERRKATKTALDKWKKAEIVRKAENMARQEQFHTVKATWAVERQWEKVAKEKFTQPAAKLGDLLKPQPKPKSMLAGDEGSSDEVVVAKESSSDDESDGN
ncbi:hypothetical protein PAXRUDRAFT_17185 [Paxillus rubicundulus Ve08.2h10]|uniref:Uncharacterized protein n=1 Tax=Paxillus rubicundulus Ve08.2h10 TaxID=930991 RepID=A0A0D0CRF5_9AGAM|nr:hypothetical protein PAXRUDRAFT_17185 [Paxillus rubicundulus Ve08.2h10]